MLEQAGPNGTGTVRYITPESREMAQNSTANPAGPSMSAGVKAGIAVAIVSVIAIAASLILLYFRARRKKKNKDANDKPELEGTKVGRSSDEAGTLTEIDGTVRYELESPMVDMWGNRVYEAHGESVPSELPAHKDEKDEIMKLTSDKGNEKK
jgi:hypothetical protein